MITTDHLESALARVQRIVSTASGEHAPITKAEAFEHIVEELELAGLGAPSATPPGEARNFA